ncbi:MAG: DUF2971 domain-containing protein [bacterium]
MKEPTKECEFCKKIFEKKMLHCPHCNHPGVTKLYKYVPYNQYSLAILINKEIWFPKANSLNDPFEFQFKLSDTSINGIPIEKDSIDIANDQSKNLGVLSLSELNNDILMWAHYTENHSGFCIEFNRSEKNEY